MKNPSGFAPSVLRLGVAALLAVGLMIPAMAQQSPSQPKGIPYDWSHHHMVFSNPGTFQDAMKNGTYDQWVRIVSDPRFQQQQMRRAARQWQASGVAAGNPDDLVLSPAKRLKRDWSMNMGSGGTVGADQYPAVFSAFTSAKCDSATQPDFAVFNTGLTGSGTQPSIFAYDNLYSSCSGTSPLIYFRYNTSGTITTSVAMAGDGVQMAFVQDVSGVANLVILKSKRNTAGTNAGLVTPTSVTAANYRTCTAPCMTEIALNGNPVDTYSSPYYDFSHDVLYVGDDSGILHKFQFIFNSGTPSEVSTGWPVNIDAAVGGSTTDPLTSPVYDSTSGNVLVFITGTADVNGAYLARVPAAGTTVTVSTQLGAGAGQGFIDGPLVDSTAARVYGFLDHLFVSSNAGIVQLTTTFASGNPGTTKTLGASTNSTSRFPYNGTFDNIYYSSGTPSSPSGNIYACGRAATANPTLYQIQILSNVMQTPAIGPALTTAAGAGINCSPVAEFFNTSSSVDWIFLSVTGNNKTTSPISCPSGTGCIMNFNVTLASGFGALKATTATSLEASGTSGIVIDNALGGTGDSNVYFSPLADQTCTGNGSIGSNGVGGCAIQASQAAP
jgi:hypothetical protein